jgi:hypothetical protein
MILSHSQTLPTFSLLLSNNSQDQERDLKMQNLIHHHSWNTLSLGQKQMMEEIKMIKILMI